MSTYEIGVEMCFKNILDFAFILIGPVDIRLHFSQWINNGDFSITFNIICTLRQTTCVNLFYFHFPKCIYIVKISIFLIEVNIGGNILANYYDQKSSLKII